MIAHKGMNCHVAGLVNIADKLGVNTPALFHNLWSETCFTDSRSYNLYTSKRFYENLSSSGIALETQTDTKSFGEILTMLPQGDFLLLGMDTYYIPWHPVYGYFHGPHFVAGKKISSGVFTCLDPIYGNPFGILTQENILSGAFELDRLTRTTASFQDTSYGAEASAILQSKALPALIHRINFCRQNKQELYSLRKYSSALINNRLMYKKFLEACLPPCKLYDSLFDREFFKKWEAVQNGLIKISIVPDFHTAAEEVCSLINSVFEEELRFAEILLC